MILATTSAYAQQFTADRICDLLTDRASSHAMYMFVDAKDTSTALKLKKFYTFKINHEKTLGDFFTQKKSWDGESYLMSQLGVTYGFHSYSFGRMLTQIEGIPMPLRESSNLELKINPDGTVPTKKAYFWLVYGLCKDARCTNPDQTIVEKGDWYLTDALDDQRVSNQDVYYFIFPGKKPPSVLCVN